MADQSSRRENPSDSDHIQEDPSNRHTKEGNSTALDLVKSIFAGPEALHFLQSAFTNSPDGASKAPKGSNSGASKTPHIEPEVQIIHAGRRRPKKRHRQMINQCPMML